MSWRFLLAAACCFGAMPAAAQTVGGSVLEQGTLIGVEGATVSLQQVGLLPRAAVRTDSSGAFLLPLATRSGRYIIRVEHPSFMPFQQQLQLSTEEALTLQIQLGREAIPLEPLIVTARIQRRLQSYYERLRRREGSGRILAREELDGMIVNRTTDYLRYVTGVRVERISGGNFVRVSNPLGNCTPLIFIDGIPIVQRGPDDVDALLNPGMVEGIEVYPGMAGLPAEFAAAQEDGCGAIAFWTRDVTGRALTWTRFFLSVGAIAAFIISSWKIML